MKPRSNRIAGNSNCAADIDSDSSDDAADSSGIVAGESERELNER